jgi:hypothetical protein
MKKKLILTAIPAILLAFGLVLAGCPTGGGGGGEPPAPVAKSLLITGITQAQVDAFASAAPAVALFPVGTTSPGPSNYVASAAASDFSLSSPPAPYTATALLYDASGNRWTGSGTYDIFFQFGTNGLTKKNVSFTGAATSVAQNSFTVVP